MSDREHVLIVNPWNREYLCGEPLPDSPMKAEATFEIKRGRNMHDPNNITINFDFNPETELTSHGAALAVALTEDLMCPKCHMMLVIAHGNGIAFTTPNLKTQIKKIVRENSK